MLAIIADVVFWFWLVWTWSYLIWDMRGRPESSIKTVLQETLWIFKVSILVKMAVYDPLAVGIAWLPLLWALDLFWFWIIRNFDDDDRWKKRRARAAAKVKEAAGRLVVVPEPVPVSTK